VKFLTTFMVIFLSACLISQSRQPSPAEIKSTSLGSPTSAPNIPANVTDSSIRNTDFKNFTYDWYPSDSDIPATGTKITLKEGSMDTGFGYGKEPREFFLIDDGVQYGDLTGDGVEEAVVVLGIITSGTARANIVFVYGLSEGKPARLWTYQTGDRGDHGYHNVSIENGELIIERYKPKIIDYQGQKHDMSQSDTYVRDYYKWKRGRFDKLKTDEVPTDPSDSSPWVQKRKSEAEY
jgi:hypothetical protein